MFEYLCEYECYVDVDVGFDCLVLCGVCVEDLGQQQYCGQCIDELVGGEDCEVGNVWVWCIVGVDGGKEGEIEVLYEFGCVGC